MRVLVPTDLSEEQREMAEKLSESLGPENLPGGHGEESFFSRVRRAFQ